MYAKSSTTKEKKQTYSALSIEEQQRTPIISENKHTNSNHIRNSKCHCARSVTTATKPQLLIVVWLILCTALLTNIDRIIGAFSSSTSSTKRKPSDIYDSYDIVIVGGGASGIMSMYYLLDKYGDQKSILLIEKHSRIGGRTFTTYIEHRNKSIHFENSAMRMRASEFNDLHYKILNFLGLCSDIVPFDIEFLSQKKQMDDHDGKVDNYTNTVVDWTSKRSLYLRNYWGLYSNYSSSVSPNSTNPNPNSSSFWNETVYHFTEFETEKYFNDQQQQQQQQSFTRQFMDLVVIENTNGTYLTFESLPEMNESEWKHIRSNWTFMGTPLYQITSDIICRLFFNLSTEYYAYTRFWTHQCGYEEQANRAWDFRDTRVDPKYVNYSSSGWAPTMTLKHGYGSPIQRYHHLIVGTLRALHLELENHLWLSRELVGIEYTANDSGFALNADDAMAKQFPYLLSYKSNINTDTGAGVDVDTLADAVHQILAKQVILAVAPMHLQSLLPYLRPINSKNAEYIVNAVAKIHNFKITFVYDADFWITQEIFAKVQSNSDDALETLYMSPAWTNGTLTVFHFYATVANAQYWQKLQAMGEYSRPKQLYPVSNDVLIRNDSTMLLRASVFVVNEVLKQLRSLLNVEVEQPLAAFVCPLGTNDSHLDGTYAWKYGYNIDYVLEHVQQPNLQEDIFIVQSSYSVHQTVQWGAWHSAQQNLIRNFGFDPLQNYTVCPKQNSTLNVAPSVS